LDSADVSLTAPYFFMIVSKSATAMGFHSMAAPFLGDFERERETALTATPALRGEVARGVRFVVLFEVVEGIFQGFLIVSDVVDPKFLDELTLSIQNIKVREAVFRVVTADLVKISVIALK
jgi:hypothetical protein